MLTSASFSVECKICSAKILNFNIGLLPRGIERSQLSWFNRVSRITHERVNGEHFFAKPTTCIVKKDHLVA